MVGKLQDHLPSGRLESLAKMAGNSVPKTGSLLWRVNSGGVYPVGAVDKSHQFAPSLTNHRVVGVISIS